MQIRIAIVEDNPDTLKRLMELLTQAQGFEFIGGYDDPSKALHELKDLDILLLDIGLPGLSGIEVLKEVKNRKLTTKVVMHTVFEDADSIIAAIEHGADGYILKSTPQQLILAELQVIMQGGAGITPKVALKVIERLGGKNKSTSHHSLTKRELEILNLISLGLTYAEVAEDLEISPNTVRRHLENIYSKLDVNNRVQALSKARQAGLIED